jgi:hypothetical protein
VLSRTVASPEQGSDLVCLRCAEALEDGERPGQVGVGRLRVLQRGRHTAKPPERDGFLVAVTGLAADRQGLLVAADRLPMAALCAMDLAEIVQSLTLPATIAELAADGKVLLVAADRLLVASLLLVDAAEVVDGDALAEAVAELVTQPPALFEAVDRLRIALLLPVDAAEVVERPALGVAVASLPAQVKLCSRQPIASWWRRR